MLLLWEPFPFEAEVEMARIYWENSACFYKIAQCLIACFWYIFTLNTHTRTHTLQCRIAPQTHYSPIKTCPKCSNTQLEHWNSVPVHSDPVPSLIFSWTWFLLLRFSVWFFFFCHWSSIKGGHIICNKFSKALNKLNNHEK